MPNELTESQSDVQLLPCPFCGGEARLWPVVMPFDADCDAITVQCSQCDAIGADVLVAQDVHGQSDLPDLEAEARAIWNTRTLPRDPQGLVEALRRISGGTYTYLENGLRAAIPIPARQAQEIASAALAAWEAGK